MTPEPQNVYQPADAIVSSNFSPYSPPTSRVRRSTDTGKRRVTVQSHSSQNMGNNVYDEHAPLLGGSVKKVKKPFLRPRPMWLVPFAVVASLVRGMTLAPRVQVYTQLSCNAIYGHDVYDHTNTTDGRIEQLSHIPFYSSLDPTGPHIDNQLLHSLESNYPVFQTFSNSSNTEDNDDDDEPDPRAVPSRRCLTDAAVQAGAARIQTIMTTTMGALSALSTGWWGHFGERHGRLKVLAASTFGLFLTDLVFILVSTPHSIFAAHGHKLLIVTPIIEGLLGGWSTLQGATSAYVSDCTSDGSRAHVFSRFTGVFYLGFSVGPALGAFLIRHPIFPVSGSHIHNGAPTVTSVFYIAAMCSFLNLLLTIFVFPESLDKKKAQQSQLPLIIDEESEDENQGQNQGFLSRVFSPLLLFMPKKIQTPEGNHRYDWSLTLMAVALFAYLLSTGIFQIKYLYASHVYGWGAEQLSYYISLMGGARAVHTLLIMPWVISTFKPKPKPKGKLPSSTTPANSVVARSAPVAVTSPTSPMAPTPTTPGKKPKPTLAQLAKEMSFDLLLIRSSILIDFCSQALVSISPTDGPTSAFVAFTSLSSFGAGLTPAVNSFALCVLQMQAAVTSSTTGNAIPSVDAGKLFGALAVLQAIAQMVLGPMLFGLIYGLTVAQYPKTIFIVAGGILFFAFAAVNLIRSNSTYRPKQQQKRTARSRDQEIERGRSRVSKDISSVYIPSSPSSGFAIETGPSSSGSSSGLSGKTLTPRM